MALRVCAYGFFGVLQNRSTSLTIFSYNQRHNLKFCKRPHAKIFSHLRDQFTYFWRLLTKMAKIHSLHSKRKLNQAFGLIDFYYVNYEFPPFWSRPKVSELISKMRNYFCMGSFAKVKVMSLVIGKNCQACRTVLQHSEKSIILCANA